MIKNILSLSFCALMLLGCFPNILKQPAPKINYYYITVGEPFKMPSKKVAITIKNCNVAPSYDRAALVYIDKDGKGGLYKNHEWLTHISDLITEHIVRSFRNSDSFKAILSYAETIFIKYELSISIDEFGEYRDGTSTWSKISGSATLIENPINNPNVLFQNNFSEKIEVNNSDVSQIVIGLNTILNNVVSNIIIETWNAVPE